MSRLDMPVTSSMTLHGGKQMAAEATPSNNGALGLTFYDADGCEVHDLTVFTGNGLMARELEIAINAVLLKHGRLNTESLRAVG